MRRKWMDQNGRLFGVISVIDLLVIAVVAVLAVALYMKNHVLDTTSTSTGNTPITFTMECYNVRDYVVQAIQVGDAVYDKDRSSGGAIGKVTKIEQLPSGNITELSDGTIAMVSAEGCTNLRITVEGVGQVSQGRYKLNRVYELGINAARNFYTQYALFTGTVLEIH